MHCPVMFFLGVQKGRRGVIEKVEIGRQIPFSIFVDEGLSRLAEEGEAG